MKSASSSRNRLLSYLRVGSGITLISAAAAMAFVAVKPSSPVLLGESTLKHEAIDKFRMDRDALFEKKSAQMLVGNRGENDQDPASEAEAAYAARAYPADEIPLQLSLNAQKAFTKIKTRSGGAKTAGNWTLIGPSIANYPGVLSFTGASYTASGRITALAIAPNCGTNGCRLWVAAAGGGIWRTDNALSGSGPNWKFLSGSFGTNAIGTLTYDAAHNAL